MNRHLATLAFAAILAFAPLAGATAAPAFTGTQLNLRAGPGQSYPVVTVLPARASLTVFGCLEGWGWCDVAWGGARGWASAVYLRFRGHATPVMPLHRYGPTLGIPVVRFQLHNYWDRHYRARPWYASRDRWAPPPRPLYRPTPPPRPPHARAPHRPPQAQHRPPPRPHYMAPPRGGHQAGPRPAPQPPRPGHHGPGRPPAHR